MYSIKAARYPNNEIRVTRSQSFISRSRVVPDENGEVDCEILASDDFFEWQESIEKSPPLSLVPNSKTQRSDVGYGSLPSKPTVFGLNAKRQLIRSGAAMEKTVDHEECLFLTGTLPGSTEGAFSAIAAYSGYIVNSLKAWIATRVSSKLDFYCWEYQKRGALHLHYCVHVPEDCDREFIQSGFKAWWISALSRVGERSNTDLFRKNSGKTHLSNLDKVRAVAEVVKKGVARYLSKYLSKSASPKRGAGRFFTPSRWWGTSRPLKSLLESLTDECEILEGSYFPVIKRWEDVKALVDGSESVTYRYPHRFGMGETSVCYPTSEDENNSLWDSLYSMSIIHRLAFQESAILPSRDLKALRSEISELLSSQCVQLSPSFQGLHECVKSYLTMMMALTPSTSPSPQSLLLVWAARTSELVYLLRFTPLDTRQTRKALETLLNTLEICIEHVADNGWS